MLELPYKLLTEEEKNDANQYWKWRTGNCVILLTKKWGRDVLIKVTDVPLTNTKSVVK